MDNKVMERALKAGECLDVMKEGRPFGNGNRYFKLERFVDEVDYCDASTERWIWSIGKRKADGVILASVEADLYQHEAFECLFLR